MKREIRTKLKFNPKCDSKNKLIAKLLKHMPEDEFSSKIIITLISKLDATSSDELTDFLVDNLIDESVNEYINPLLYLNEILTSYSEGKDLP